jgi:hypothetical protein
MDDLLDRLNTELHRRVDALIEALRADTAAEASRNPDAISRETVWQARLALAELAFGDALRERMALEIAPLENQGDDPATEHRRMLLGLGRFMSDLRSIGSTKLSDLTTGDTLIMLGGKPGQWLRPPGTGPGQKAFGEIDLHLLRRCVLRVYVECARTDAKNQAEFLKSLPHGPGYDQFRGWSQRVPAEERAAATAIGEALRMDQPLTDKQSALWDEIKDRDLDEMLRYLLRLQP